MMLNHSKFGFSDRHSPWAAAINLIKTDESMEYSKLFKDSSGLILGLRGDTASNFDLPSPRIHCDEEDLIWTRLLEA